MKNSQEQNEDLEDSEVLEDSEIKELETFLIRKSAFWYTDSSPEVARDFTECCNKLREERASIEYEQDRYNLINILHVIFFSQICGDNSFTTEEFSYDEIPDVQNGNDVCNYMLSKAVKLCYLVIAEDKTTEQGLSELMSELRSQKDYVAQCIRENKLDDNGYFEIESLMALIGSVFSLSRFISSGGLGEHQFITKNEIAKAIILSHGLELENTMMLAEAAMHSKVSKFISKKQRQIMSLPSVEIDSMMVN